MRALFFNLSAYESQDSPQLAFQQVGRCAIDSRIPGLWQHAMTEHQCLPVVDREGFIFVVNDFAARPEYPDPAQEVTADGRKPRPLPEGAAITVEHVVSRLEI